MLLTARQSYELLAEHRVFAKEICDKCGQLLGAVRYTRRGENGVWCSRLCRGNAERPVIRRGGRPRRFESNADRQRAYRGRVLGVTKPSYSLMETKNLEAQKSLLSHYPLTPTLPALETGFRTTGT